MVTISQYSAFFKLRSNQAKNSDRFDYAWKWFAFHADQRTKVFNFMLIAVGIFANAVVMALDKSTPAVAASLCFVAAGLTFAFALLDKRNQQLVWFGEDVLFYLEHSWIFKEPAPGFEYRGGNTSDYGILRREREKKCDDKKGCLTKVFFAVCRWLRSVPCDTWAGKHRIWLKGIALGLSAFFFGAGIVILEFPECVTKQGPQCTSPVPEVRHSVDDDTPTVGPVSR